MIPENVTENSSVPFESIFRFGGSGPGSPQNQGCDTLPRETIQMDSKRRMAMYVLYSTDLIRSRGILITILSVSDSLAQNLLLRAKIIDRILCLREHFFEATGGFFRIMICASYLFRFFQDGNTPPKKNKS